MLHSPRGPLAGTSPFQYRFIEKRRIRAVQKTEPFGSTNLRNVYFLLIYPGPTEPGLDGVESKCRPLVLLNLFLAVFPWGAPTPGASLSHRAPSISRRARSLPPGLHRASAAGHLSDAGAK